MNDTAGKHAHRQPANVGDSTRDYRSCQRQGSRRHSRQPTFSKGSTKDRPRSGSWGAQELHYCMGTATLVEPGSDDPQASTSGLLSKLKMYHDNSRMFTSSVMTLPSRPPTVSDPHQHKRPPLPLEMIHPEQGHVRSTPHPSLVKHEPANLNKPLPASCQSIQKKKRPGIKSIGRLFRTLGKPRVSNMESGVTERHSVENPVNTNSQCQQGQVYHLSAQLDIPRLALNDGIPILQRNASISAPQRPALQSVIRRIATCDDLQRRSSVRPALRRSLSFDGSANAEQNKPGNSLAQSRTLNRRPQYKLSEDESETEDDFDTDLEDMLELDQTESQESQIVGDRLSKRLSGGHFGSAGGLIFSTFPLSGKHTDTNSQQPSSIHSDVPTNSETWSGYQATGSIGYTETSESESFCLTTPQNENGLRDFEGPDIVTFNVDFSTMHPTDNPIEGKSQGQQQEEEEEEEDGDNPLNQIAADTAKRIWEEDDTVYADMEHIAEWIGNGKPLSAKILKHYLSYFDFTNLRLDDAFRTFCGKLHLKAETQQIDRVLEEFSKRYWECNPSSILGNHDVVHAIVYSLLLLNTDLHVAQGDHRKMSRSAFVRNTMQAVRAQVCPSETDDASVREERRGSNLTFNSSHSYPHELKRTPSFKSSTSNGSSPSSTDMPSMTSCQSSPLGSKAWQLEIEALLREMYVSIRTRQILHPMPKDAEFNGSNRRTRRRSLQITGSRMGAFKRSVGTIMLKAARESMFISEPVEVPDRLAAPPMSPRSATSASTASFSRRRSVSSLKSSLSQNSNLTQANSATSYQAVASLLHHSELPAAFTSAAPYYKEGLVVRKHLLESAGQKAKQRDWKECFMVVDRGEIRMYRLDGHGDYNHRKSMARASIMISRVNLAEALSGRSTENGAVVGGGDWLANAQIMGEIDLKHTLSNALPSGYSRQRPHTFALQQPNGGVYLFQAGSAEQVMEWVSACNYWAARESKEPLTGGVSNMEYGWGSCLDGVQEDDARPQNFPPVTIHDWQPPVPPTVSSALEEAAQLASLHKHVKELNEELDTHRDLKHKMEIRFAGRSSQSARAMANWEKKSQYLLHEIIKYQNYCDAIEKSLALQDKALEAEKEASSCN